MLSVNANMPRPFNTQALVLRRKAFVKNSKLLYLLSQEKGLIKVIAKGSLLPTSRFSGLIEPFSLIHAELVAGRQFYYLTYASLVKNFFAKQASLAALQFAAKISGFALRMLPEEERNLRAFELTIEALEAAQAGFLPIVISWYKLNLLMALGLLPKLPKEVNRERYFFSGKEGGFIENKTAETLVFDLQTTSLFLELLRKPLADCCRQEEAFPSSSLKIIDRAIDQFLCYHS